MRKQSKECFCIQYGTCKVLRPWVLFHETTVTFYHGNWSMGQLDSDRHYYTTKSQHTYLRELAELKWWKMFVVLVSQ